MGDIFQGSLHTWQRGAPILWRTSYILNPLFSNFVPPPTYTHTSLSPPSPTLTVLSIVLFFWLNGWSRHIWCAILLYDNMHLHQSSLGTLVPEGPWCAFYATKRQVWHMIHTHTPNTQRKITLERVN